MDLRFVTDKGYKPAEQGPMFLLQPLYLTIAGAVDEPSAELNDRVLA